jgi:predicted HNH restriction endonuclease
MQSYLPHVAGIVVCGCFDPDLNARAPFEIDVGDLPDVLRYADILAKQTTAIPVFLKRAINRWEFVGDFTPVRLMRDTNDLFPSKPFRRRGAVAVLYLSESFTSLTHEQDVKDYLPEVQAFEGRWSIQQHLRRERSSVLVEAKKRAFRSEHGLLQCQACELSERELPKKLGTSCFEVHHLIPIGDRQEAILTSLDDLAILCANCHCMIHDSVPMLDVAGLVKRLAGED